VIAALMVPLVSLFAFLPAVLSGSPVAMDRVYGGLAYLLAFMAPFFTMRLLAEERRTGTLELLLTSPLRDWEVVLGKWLGALLFFIAITAFLVLFAAVIMYYEPTHQVISVAGISLSIGNLDLGPTFTGYFGVLLEAAALLALGLLCSSLTKNQILAAFVALVFGLTLVFLLGLGSFLPPPLSTITQYIGAYDHFASFNQGRIVLSDLVYFLTVIAGALFLTVRVLESRRWR
jgi:ABC-2 type transport system permease protein